MSEEAVYKKEVQGGHFAVYGTKPNFPFYEVKQTHSAIISLLPHGEEADGMILPFGDVKALCIKTADCLPVYIKGKNKIAFIHAGWRGLHNKILCSDLLREIGPEYAFIGPAICREHYEVGSEFLNYFGSQFVKEVKGKYYFDLIGQATSQLKQEYPNIIVEKSKLCTYESPKLHSFRLNKTTERNYNIFTNL
jgi:polyphenol oxidase